MEDYSAINNEEDHELANLITCHHGIIKHHLKEIEKLIDKHIEKHKSEE